MPLNEAHLGISYMFLSFFLSLVSQCFSDGLIRNFIFSSSNGNALHRPDCIVKPIQPDQSFFLLELCKKSEQIVQSEMKNSENTMVYLYFECPYTYTYTIMCVRACACWCMRASLFGCACVCKLIYFLYVCLLQIILSKLVTYDEFFTMLYITR